MSLSPGTTFGAFEISGLLGVGGMGEVYRARDTKLGREVAIKVLPEVFAKDKDRLARFEREARLLAQLNHKTGTTTISSPKQVAVRIFATHDCRALRSSRRRRCPHRRSTGFRGFRVGWSLRSNRGQVEQPNAR